MDEPKMDPKCKGCKPAPWRILAVSSLALARLMFGKA